MTSSRVNQERSLRSVRDRRYRYDRARGMAYQHSDDIFAVHPLRRSFYISAGSWAFIVLPALFFSGKLQALFLIGFGWLAAAGIVFVTPIFFWCLAEVGWKAIERRRWPTIDELELSPRAQNLLHRHGYDSIDSVERAPDTTLLLMSNMDARTVHEIRRAISLWRYKRWQEQGFPASDMP